MLCGSRVGDGDEGKTALELLSFYTSYNFSLQTDYPKSKQKWHFLFELKRSHLNINIRLMEGPAAVINLTLLWVELCLQVWKGKQNHNLQSNMHSSWPRKNKELEKTSPLNTGQPIISLVFWLTAEVTASSWGRAPPERRGSLLAADMEEGYWDVWGAWQMAGWGSAHVWTITVNVQLKMWCIVWSLGYFIIHISLWSEETIKIKFT